MTVAVHAPGQEVHENTLFLLLTFAVNLKTTIKNKSINHLLSPNENKIKILSDKQKRNLLLADRLYKKYRRKFFRL